MTINKIYRYLGKNGVINTPILLEGVNYVLYYRLMADANKVLINQNNYKAKVIDIPEDDLDNWHEIEDNGQK